MSGIEVTHIRADWSKVLSFEIYARMTMMQLHVLAMCCAETSLPKV